MHFLAPSFSSDCWQLSCLGYPSDWQAGALPVRFAAMQLLMRAERRISARRRLREILLLLARTSVAAALP